MDAPREGVSWETHDLISAQNASGNLLARLYGASGFGKEKHWKRRK